MYRILVVEDEKPIADLLRISLTGEGYACKCVFDGKEAADILENEGFDLILLDIMLPLIDGYELMEYIRPSRTPVIFLTARTTVYDRVRGLKAGADDYISKPFEIAEMLARVESVIRRCHGAEKMLTFGDIRVDTWGRTVTKGNKTIVTIEDTGRGMRADDLKRIRDAFYMVDKSRARSQGGAGLGLAICDAVLKKHGFSLSFASEVGKGTCATVILKGVTR